MSPGLIAPRSTCRLPTTSTAPWATPTSTSVERSRAAASFLAFTPAFIAFSLPPANSWATVCSRP